MVMFNVTLKKEATNEDLEKAKEEARKTGGTIRHEYKLIKGFTYEHLIPSIDLFGKALTTSLLFSVEYPDDHVHVLQSTSLVNVEQDGPAKTQK
ncbi:hypothetical protein LOZ53_000565 [Ophidiomyces ophidiicola]|uniref:Uncharacterized protein n=1 Tax=Ophidiomyces ophidiicola TaxID=1387563 RepID=A0ACB8V3K0_9EURO|nr:uncharacterized protein LOZ57_005183 [Ophidiomyces ophidiicola]KAI1914955.1 hypothetical protein LOZ61_001878 [Ophidiomyces ophidiicola]KAI1923363.1 hypothetical protein LOZ64_001039 [Ophidiomyces ophidiicola]KAI1930061.1 hypothetical protein LOZ60_001119 [Ophidiomyces ophidiicola]KAI1943235.1 hypothetical protein LOZ57_005183 [Ophidiomyces ophidiicola]KAI1954954.1 hypothetical protein LOZ62_000460 [Ophidiomyces ophidiicola]